MAPNLRVYLGPEQNCVTPVQEPKRETVNIRLGDVFPLLADAVLSERTWLQDFEDDEISLSADLYEVILAYQHFRQTSA